VQIYQILIIPFEFVFGDLRERPVKIIDGFEEVFGEALEGEVLCRLDFATSLVLEVTVFGYLAFIFVLLRNWVSEAVIVEGVWEGWYIQ
jgi:hypothetical protein